jgi:DNA-binding transcriptional regulator GbsR (MarR family)
MTKQVIDEFIEQMGLAAQADGLPRIAGRMLGFFVIEGGTRSFSELAERLQVSRGSISTNARLLESLGVIQRTCRPGDRQDYFRLADDPYARMLEGYVTRMQRVEKLVADTRAELPPDARDARQRLKEMLNFYDVATKSTQNVLAQWAKRLREVG